MEKTDQQLNCEKYNRKARMDIRAFTKLGIKDSNLKFRVQSAT